ncbi:PQQ-binding-like beta-propeller repeat protein [Paenibacillus sp. PR3]|uniref:PQQ-binding-like beta-propeller repeat protein n=1 Tax=Paenibacillus terricola TaxID=2763503 RepID=A0ABR8MR91_9BACL|nr:PQQ-binding-like beta-propeller repeat protein [Paenibacillus terricola]MBD3918508.1 PQQ-binding-like beta-propeller repeat protein [Paenibacillus terricola]
MQIKWTSSTAGCLAIGLAISGLLSGSVSAQGSAGVNASYSYATISSKKNIPLATPIWSAELELPSSDAFNWPDVEAANGNVFYVKSGVLYATSVSSGKKLWSFGKKLQINSIAAYGNYVYAFEEGGVVYRVDAKTGKGAKLFQLRDAKGTVSQSINEISVSETEGVLYVLSSNTVAAVQLSDGKLKWRNDDFYYTSVPKLVNGKLLMYTTESGAIMVGTTYAIDPKTGKTLWRLGGSHSKLLGADGDRLYYEDQWPNIDDTEASIAKLDIVSLETGEVVESKTYPSPQLSTGAYVPRSNQLLIDGDNLFIGAGGNGIYRYGVHADPKTSKPAYISANGSWIAGPYNGKLYFQDSTFQGLFAVKQLENSYVSYYGVDNPISRLDLIDSGMYIGQTDGSVLAYNVKTSKSVFRYETDARNYGPFQTIGNKLIVQADNKLYAFNLSSELTQPITDSDAVADGYAKASAKLSVNGEVREFNPNMMSAANRMFVPLRFLTETLGAKVVYDSKTKSSTVTYEGRAFTITEGKSYAVIAGKQQDLSFAPVTLNGSLYVPVKDIGELLGISVSWNASSRTVEVVTNPQK